MSSAHLEQLEEQRRARARIERSDEGFEITLSSAFDEAFLYFVSYAPSKRSAPRSSTPATAPEELPKRLQSASKAEVDEEEPQRPKRVRKPKEAR